MKHNQKQKVVILRLFLKAFSAIIFVYDPPPVVKRSLTISIFVI